MTVQATELLATPTVPCFPAGGTLRLELCNKTNFSFSILLSLLLQTSAAASCFQWSCPEIHLSPLALQRVGASPGVRHHLGFSPLGMSGEGELEFCSLPTPSFILHAPSRRQRGETNEAR